MKKQEIEIKVGPNKLCFGKDKILYATLVGDLSAETVNTLYEFFERNKNENMINGKVRFFVDLTNSGKPSMEARKLTYALSESKDIGKFAIIGMNPVAKVIAAFFMGNSKKKGMKFFNIKEEAIEWLQKE
ncbi:MAG: STAS/SEC14 domain-containing protein [bacterium]|nr:STAS/SEC14 domain-containing protein [bacterium]